MAVSSGIALTVAGLTVSVQASVPAHAKPAPSARDVRDSHREVHERAEDVGRTKTMLAQANAELERLGVAAAVAVERYNGEIVKLQQAKKSYVDTQARLAEASRRLGVAQEEMAAFAAEAYRADTGYNPWSAAVAGNGGPQGFMDRAGMMEMLARKRTDIVQKVEAARNVADVFRRQARVAVDEQTAAARRAEDARKAAAGAVAQQRSAVGRIEAEKRLLEQRLGAAEERAASLKRAREAALARAEARRARITYGGGPGRAAIAMARGSARGSLVVRAALKWLGTPYSWGGGTSGGPSYGIAHGAGTFGFDCSGLALYAWSKAGVRLDHWTGTQWTSGPHVPLSNLRAGDLVFFANDTSNPDTIHHVGIYIGQGRMIEAPYTGARVRISTIHRNGLIGATRPAG
ncbi:NlpC/P60 family protein [Spirillospora sp. NPDC048911]|uniref:NlpC/P60 family protein n=1 Tax=Spirillospora sp. NPDC048911 TaxID=3364527 RepID=UPI003719631F